MFLPRQLSIIVQYFHFARVSGRVRLRPACKRPACTRVSPPPSHLSGQTHVCKQGCPASQRVASERAKRTLWLEAAIKLVCPLLPGRSCGGGEGGSDNE
jgi:hypothetical protein